MGLQASIFRELVLMGSDSGFFFLPVDDRYILCNPIVYKVL